ncbi:hypothetical protein ILUMI_12984 [Ignelater luminosus]|uniref:Uncharacterized protein n=1 Tax=Ignelater luminosus TaxID=2038154 RepID=A0A8K0GCF1_IGNLU|nr:hypothetical protein ILUMI_12984 [Ignelater luminosus]
MGRFIFYSIELCFLVYLVSISYCQAENSRGPKRTRVSPYAGLVPFLRTGRSRLQLPSSESELGENYKRAKPSRTSIMAFPRVGRSETMEWGHDDGWNVQKKSNTGSPNNGLWFGPRLGRIHKRQDYKSDIPLAYFYISDYTPRLGRESEETMDETDTISEDQVNNDKTMLESA